jgi:hypothetical protein
MPESQDEQQPDEAPDSTRPLPKFAHSGLQNQQVLAKIATSHQTQIAQVLAKIGYPGIQTQRALAKIAYPGLQTQQALAKIATSHQDRIGQAATKAAYPGLQTQQALAKIAAAHQAQIGRALTKIAYPGLQSEQILAKIAASHHARVGQALAKIAYPGLPNQQALTEALFPQLLDAARTASGVSEQTEERAAQVLDEVSSLDLPLVDGLAIEELESAVEQATEHAAEQLLEEGDQSAVPYIVALWVYALVFLLTLEKTIEHPEVAGVIGAATGINCHSLALGCMRRAQAICDKLITPGDSREPLGDD